MENAIIDILVPVVVFLILSILFVLMFVKTNWCNCRAKNQKIATATSTHGTTQHGGHGHDTNGHDVTASIDLQQVSDLSNVLFRTRKEDDDPPTYEMAMAYLRHEAHHHPC
ncbi:hypothetical protein OUZ56_031540 [Daphnia magna]|uniref:Uncharacterized protein n=1 Tax=Daphnia magna TaxID=35525 RepID=A0ABQ9ZUI6_9CRUS|nr:hypothetical protein OUZ56_031540 [Daphnia magna]